MIRFLNDSQGCIFWYLNITKTGHRILSTYWMYDDEDDQATEEIDHNDLFECAPSLSVFLYRFWIENELWYTWHNNTPMPKGGDAYLDHYHSQPPLEQIAP